MHLPENIAFCVRRLEAAGFAAYAVGGCVRDALLGLEPHDYDLCTAALPEQIQGLFGEFPLVLAGLKHGTVGVVLEGEVIEITTFRTEGGYADSRHPDWVRFVDDITLDLSRRDFTVNAMAWSPTRGLADPFGGRQDLEQKVLRAVGEPEVRFTEDALRILRGVRFSVRFGLQPEEKTLEAMFRLAPLTENLARERVFSELCKLLPLVDAKQLQLFAPILTQVIPELAPSIGFGQHNPHHLHDVFTHTAHVVEATPPELALRWAALLHDIGKPSVFTRDEQGIGHFYGHEKVSAQQAADILHRLKAPTALRQQVVALIERHMLVLTPDRKLLRRRLAQFGDPGLLQQLALQRADRLGTGTRAADPDTDEAEQIVKQLLAENACMGIRDLAIDGRELMTLGFPAGKALGICLKRLLEEVVEETLPNEKDALLDRAKELLEELT